MFWCKSETLPFLTDRGTATLSLRCLCCHGDDGAQSDSGSGPHDLNREGGCHVTAVFLGCHAVLAKLLHLLLSRVTGRLDP